MENDSIRARFWTAFDAFVAKLLLLKQKADFASARNARAIRLVRRSYGRRATSVSRRIRHAPLLVLRAPRTPHSAQLARAWHAQGHRLPAAHLPARGRASSALYAVAREIWVEALRPKALFLFQYRLGMEISRLGFKS